MALLAAALTIGGCGRGVWSVVLDLPPEAPPADTVVAVRAAPNAGLQYWAERDTVRPPIEEVRTPDSVKSLLPRDHAGNIDWMEALRTGVIKPRSTAPGDSSPPIEPTFRFGYDFYFPGPSEAFDAFFPHSAHTEWASCEHCHSRIFRYRDTSIQMADVLQGRYCGECHGAVAFPVTTGCERCHRDFPQPPNRAQPELIGDIQMTRYPPGAREDPAGARPAEQQPADSAGAPTEPPDPEVTEPALERRGDAATFPPATFPHWVHRMRYRCKACHMSIFEPEAGANVISMDDIDRGEACGRCHDGETAFAAGFGECLSCHRTPESVAESAPAGEGE